MFIYLLDIKYSNNKIETLFQADNVNDLIIFIKKYVNNSKKSIKGQIEIRKVML